MKRALDQYNSENEEKGDSEEVSFLLCYKTLINTRGSNNSCHEIVVSFNLLWSISQKIKENQMTSINLFPQFKASVSAFKDVRSRKSLLIKDFGKTRIYYAPFDYVNPEAKIFIVGITPGEVQMANMLVEAKRLLNLGISDSEVIKCCKTVGSFSGPMRKNLVEMMDSVGIAKYLNIKTSEQLFNEKSDLANLTSCIRYPTFVVKNGEESNFNGEIRERSELYKFAASYTLEEIRQAPKALILPLGPKVISYLKKVLEGTPYEDRLLPELPHPSNANKERIAYFLGQKKREDLSVKTNADKLDSIRNEFKKFMASHS